MAAALFRIKLGNVLEFKESVGVSDISAAFGCLHLWLTYVIISSGFSPLDCHFRPWSMLWSLFLYLFSFRKVERERIREYTQTVHLISLGWLLTQSCGQHKCDHYFSDMVHIRNWTIDLVSFKFIIVISIDRYILMLLSVPERFLLCFVYVFLRP